MSCPSDRIKKLMETVGDRDFEILERLSPQAQVRYGDLRLEGRSPDEAKSIVEAEGNRND